MLLDPFGVLCALVAGVGWAMYIVFGQKAGQAHGASASTWGLMVAALPTVPIGPVDAGAKLMTRRFEPALAAIAGAVLLHERLTVTQWTAIGALVAASVVTAMMREPSYRRAGVRGARPVSLTVPSDWGFGLPGVDVWTLVALAVLYPACRWYADPKTRSRSRVLSYL